MKRLFLCTLAVLLIPAMLRAQDNSLARRPFGQHTVSFSATPTFDAGISESFKMTLTGNVTSSTLVGVEAGMLLRFDICQDGTGGRTFAWPSQMVGPIAILSGANVCTTEVFQFDGTSAINPTTATSGGGGSGTVNSGTVNHIAYYAATGTTISSDANLDDGGTAANTLTYAGTGGISAPTFNATGTGSMALVGNENTCSGAAVGKDVLCLGDLTSHSIETSLNGGSFFPLPQHDSSSPVPHGVMLAEAFPLVHAASRGTVGQPFIEGSPTGDPGFAQLDLSVATNVVNRLAKANQTASTVYNDQANTATSAFTLDASAATGTAAAFIVPRAAGATSTTSGNLKYDTTSNNWHFGTNSADSIAPVLTGSAPTNGNCVKWSVVSAHIEFADALTTCGGGSTPRLDQVLAATNAWTTLNADNPLSLQFAATTAGRTSFEITESAAATSTGTPFLLNVHTLASSTLNPCQFTARGTSNGIRCDAVTGTLSAIGSANINSTQINGVSVTGTPAVGQIPIATSSTASAWGDPIVSYNYVNLWTAQDITVTRTSSVVRVSTFSQYGTLLVTFAGITGSPAGCTVQIKSADSAGNLQNNGSAVSVTVANGTTSQTFTPAAALGTASQMQAVFACSTYPTAGTLTLDFAPAITTYVPNTVATNPPANASTNLAQVAGTTTDTNSGNKSAGTLRVVLATDQPNLTTPLNDNVAQVAGTATSVNNGTTDAGTLRVTLSSDSTGQAIPAPTTASGDAVSACNILSAASTNSTSCKGSAGNFYGYEIYNTTTTIYYLRMYNTSTAPTCSSATGFIRSIPIPPAGAAGQAGGAISNQIFPVNYGTGIGYCITGGSSSTDNTNAATGIFGEIRYK